MPKPAKRDQLLQVRKDLAEAVHLLAGEDINWEKGFIAVLRARAIVCDLTGDIDGARSARVTLARIAQLQQDHGMSIYDIVRLSDANTHQPTS